MTKNRLRQFKRNVVQKLSEKYHFVNLTPRVFGNMFDNAIIELKDKVYNNEDEYFNDIFIIIDGYVDEYIQDMVMRHNYLYIYKSYIFDNISNDLLSNILLIINFIKRYGIFSILDYIKILKYDSKSNEILGEVFLNSSIRSKLSSEDKLILDKLLQAYRIINNIIDENIPKKIYSNVSLDFYLQQIGNYSNLSFEEEQDAFRRYHEGDNDARELLINSNLRYVVKIASSFRASGVDIMDLIQEGTKGLMIAVDKYDISLGYRFSTYYDYWIKYPIIRFLKANFNLIVYPERVTNNLLKIDSARKGFEDLGILFPSLDDLALKTGLSIEKIEECLSIPKVDISLETPVGDNGYLLKDLIEDHDSCDFENFFISDDFFDELSKRERKIVEYHLGFNGEVKSFNEIGEIEGISRQRANQIFNRAIRKLKRRI